MHTHSHGYLQMSIHTGIAVAGIICVHYICSLQVRHALVQSLFSAMCPLCQEEHFSHVYVAALFPLPKREEYIREVFAVPLA